MRTTNHAARAASRTGFTLMELLVVIAILVVLIGTATPLYLHYLEKSKLNVARADCVRLSGELKNFAIANDGNYPQPYGDWTMLPLSKKPPLDPWGNQYAWQLKALTQYDGTTIMEPVVASQGPPGSNAIITSE
jgi:prepilin-type N-terminal cleavage/methylation domain-containing protein